MVQRTVSARDKKFSKQHIIPLRRDDDGCSVALQAPTYPPAARRLQAPRFKLFGILLLVPTIIMLAALILTALLGIFVVWLAVFGTMAAALVISDLLGALRYAAGLINQRPIPAGQ